MPTAWFIGYWQRRSHDTSGQNKMISIGLLIATLGFGNKCIPLPDRATSNQSFMFRIAKSSQWELGRRSRSHNSPNCWYRHWNAVPCSLPGFYSGSQERRNCHRHQRIFPRAIYWSDCWSSEIIFPFTIALANAPQGCSRHNILCAGIHSSTSWPEIQQRLLVYQLQRNQIFTIGTKKGSSPHYIDVHQGMWYASSKPLATLTYDIAHLDCLCAMLGSCLFGNSVTLICRVLSCL